MNQPPHLPWLVPSCFVIFDLEPFSLSFDFVFMFEIFKSLSFRLDRLCHLAILCLDQHAHSMHHLEKLLKSPLIDMIFWRKDLVILRFEHEHVVMNPTSAGMRHHHLHLYIQRISLTGYPAQSVGSSNTDVLDLPCLLVLITGTSQSRQHVDTSLIHIESRKSPTKSLFDAGSSRISIFIVSTKEYHSECSGRITRIMRRTLVNSFAFLVLVIGGWEIAPIQYYVTGSENSHIVVECSSVINENVSLRRNLDGWEGLCIASDWVHDVSSSQQFNHSDS
ncbi:hypothetical protein Tco_0251874 [Tanacetum coccineum]